MTRWKKRLVIVSAVGAVLGVGVWFADVSGLWTRWFGEQVVGNALVGKTEDEVRRKYGEPTSEKPGYQNLGGSVALVDPQFEPPGPLSDVPVEPMKTLIFKPRGLFHQEGGTYWVWFTLRDGVWACSSSCWYADGVNF